MVIVLGLIVGFVAAIPLGPINLLAISQVLKRGFLHGFLVGLTAAFLDIVYCFAVLTGISQIASNLKPFLPYFKLFGFVLLIGISIRLMWQSKTYCASRPPRKNYSDAHRPIIAAFLFYVSNPSLYAFWPAVGGIVTAHQWVSNTGWQPIIFATACGVGSVIWYFILTKYVSKYNHQFEPATFRKILFSTGIILLGYAVYALARYF